MKKKSKGLSLGIITAVLIAVFLSGKIIDIPSGTHEGGVISAIGVVAILLFMFMCISLERWISKWKHNRNEV